MKLTTRAIPPIDDPLRLAPDLVWLSPEVSLFGWGVAARFDPGTGRDRLLRIRDSFRDRIREADLAGEPGMPPATMFASATFAPQSSGSIGILPQVLVGRRGDLWWTTTVDDAAVPTELDDPAPGDRPRYAGSSVPDVLWLERVADAINEIQAGRLDKVVLARDYAVWSRTPFHPARLLRHLRARFPSCYVFRVADLVGASPELLMRREGTDLESLVLAGTAAVFDDREEDRRAGQALLASHKDRWEHELAVRSVASALASLGADASVPTEPSLLRLDNVRHLATHITGAVSESIDVMDLVHAAHPTAAVGGTPTDAALRLIGELEGMDRGRYSGPVGWANTAGDGEFAIALRCAELSGARARLFAGVGIVAESLPEQELEETRLKLDTMMEALAVQ